MKTKMINLVSLLILCSCSTHDVTSSKDYYPLALGNYWEFVPGEVSGGNTDLLITMEVKRGIGINAKLYYEMITNRVTATTNHRDTIYYRKDEAGNVFSTTNLKDQFEKVVFRPNAIVSEQWQYSPSTSNPTVITALGEQRIQVSATIMITKGFRFQDPSANSEKTLFLAPGIGFVSEHSTGQQLDLKRAVVSGKAYVF